MNSGRLLSMIATVSPLPTPSCARPPASGLRLLAQLVPADGLLAGGDRGRVAQPLDRRLEGQRQVRRDHLRARTATRVTLRRRRFHSSLLSSTPGAQRAGGNLRGTRQRTLNPSPVIRPMSLLRPMKNSIRTSAKPTKLARSMVCSEGRPAADLLDQAPEDVAAVERQERQQVDQPEREADHRRARRSPGGCRTRSSAGSPRWRRRRR